MSGLSDFRIACRGFGVVQNSAERLVDFVSNGCCQFASGREAVDMSKFCNTLRSTVLRPDDADDAHSARPR